MFGRRPEGKTCPLLKTACIEAQCMWWTHVRGTDPQSGAETDYPDCAVKWLPTLLLRVAQIENQTGAAVESLRNESVQSTQQLARSVLLAAQTAQPPQLAQRV